MGAVNATHPLFEQLLKPFAPKPVEVCRVVNGVRTYPTVIIWRRGDAIASGGLHVALGRTDPPVTRVFVRRWRDGKAIVTLHWSDGSWSSFPIETIGRAIEIAKDFNDSGLWPVAETMS